MIRTRKIALIPSPKQLRLLKQHADYRRDAYNSMLRDYKDRLAAKEPCDTSMLFPLWEGERASAYPQSAQLCPERRPACCLCVGKRDQGRGG